MHILYLLVFIIIVILTIQITYMVRIIYIRDILFRISRTNLIDALLTYGVYLNVLLSL